jgi:uncharacterized pyridoxamine 5'-phosphate oxidase family protein
MQIGIYNTRTKKLTVCNVTKAAEILIVDRAELYEMMKNSKPEYRHFIIFSDIEIVRPKKPWAANNLPTL